MSDMAVAVGINLVKVGVFVYDIITYPIYALVQMPWKEQKVMKRTRAEEVSVSEGICFRNVAPPHDFEIEMKRAKVETLIDMLAYACKKHNTKHALGTRKIIKEFDEMQANGKVFKKLELGDYSWITYGELERTTTSFGRGMRILGHQPKDNVVIFSETRAEWLLSALGCIQQSITVCTLYATLGDEAVIHGINETEVRHVITSHDLLPKLRSIIASCPNVTHVTYFHDQLHETSLVGMKEGLIINAFEDVVKKGETSTDEVVPPKPSDIAVVMYTSGSTGPPKGVMLAHSNLISVIIGYAACFEPNDNDIWLAYLPLAHVLELMGECVMLFTGVPLGYSTPLTMTDRSSKIKRGCLGDVSVLKPTILPSVPLIMDRIYKAILDKVAAQGPWLKALFDFAVKYKLGWIKNGWKTPICDWIVFRKVRALLGNNLRVVAVGGAPLAPDTHEFIRLALSIPVIQGYGLTETCSCATLMDLRDMSSGRTGPPVSICDIRLVDWDEGNYRVTDTPRPRGEVIVGGPNVSLGYYKNPEKTAEDFFEADGRRWFRTGDIGQVDPDGVIKLIDRKKDLVKLQYGEYVSLGKVESHLKVCPLIENICVYADSSKDYTVAIVCPDGTKLREMAAPLIEVNGQSLEKLCLDGKVKKAFLDILITVGKKAKLEKFELPGAIYLTTESWTPDTGLVTAAFKLRRKNIQTHYQEAISRMYTS